MRNPISRSAADGGAYVSDWANIDVPAAQERHEAFPLDGSMPTESLSAIEPNPRPAQMPELVRTTARLWLDASGNLWEGEQLPREHVLRDAIEQLQAQLKARQVLAAASGGVEPFFNVAGKSHAEVENVCSRLDFIRSQLMVRPIVIGQAVALAGPVAIALALLWTFVR